MRVFWFLAAHPGPGLQRQSLDVWPAGRWPQHEITFAVWSLTMHRFSNCSFEKKVHFVRLPCHGPGFRCKVCTFRRPSASNNTKSILASIRSLCVFFWGKPSQKVKQTLKFAKLIGRAVLAFVVISYKAYRQCRHQFLKLWLGTENIDFCWICSFSF